MVIESEREDHLKYRKVSLIKDIYIFQYQMVAFNFTLGLHECMKQKEPLVVLGPFNDTTSVFGTPYMWTFRREDKFSSLFRSSPDLKYPPEFSWLFTCSLPKCAVCTMCIMDNEASIPVVFWIVFTVQKSLILISKLVLRYPMYNRVF